MQMTESEYIEECEDPVVKLSRICEMIKAIDASMIKVIENGFVQDYMLNDGQVIQAVKKSTLKDITTLRHMYEQQKTILTESMGGRMTRIIPPIC